MIRSSASVMPKTDGPPFYYASFAGLWLYFAFDIKLVNSLLGPTIKDFTAYDFGGQGLICINFMTYAGHSGQNDPQAYLDLLKPVSPQGGPIPPSLGVEGSNECEFSVIVYPTVRGGQVPQGLTINDFIAGNDHTKTIGSLRVGVPCDDRIAVYWGTVNFGENKIMTHPFLYNIPSPNNVGQTLWQVTVPGDVTESFSFNSAQYTCSPFMFSFAFDASNLVPTVSNASEIIDYSFYNDSGAMRPAGSRRNVFGAFSAYDLTQVAPKQMTFTIGNSTSALMPALMIFNSGVNAVAAQTYQSQPSVAESSLYYVDI
jgi:hypothetical protein